MGTGRPWEITLRGRFRVTDPAGIGLSFRTRKAEALVALLVLHEGRAVERHDLADSLWPGVDPDRQSVNFRQTLSLAIKALGTGAVHSTRDSCRWVGEPWVTDLASDGPLLPDFVEPVFDDWRLSDGGGDGPGSHGEHPLLAAIDWASAVDRSRALEILRIMPEMLLELPVARQIRILDAILREIPAHHPLRHWVEMRKAHALQVRGDLVKVPAMIQVALASAERIGDWALAGDAMRTLIFCQSMLGQPHRALRAADRYASVSKSPEEMANMQHSRGAALMYAGAVQSGRPLLTEAQRRAAEFLPVFAVHRAMFESELGRWHEADSELEILPSYLPPLYQIQADLARAVATIHRGDSERAGQILRTSLDQATAHGSEPLVSLCWENLYFTIPDPKQRDRAFAQSQTSRRRTGNLPTPRDHTRMRRLATRTGVDLPAPYAA